MAMTQSLSLILLQSTAWLEWGGTALIAALVFIETGFLLGLIVPGGETLLFSAGLLTGVQTLQRPVWQLILIVIIAAIVGDMTGYTVGRKIGDRLHNRPDNFLFRRRNLASADQFYQKRGGWAIVMGRFLPIIRTFNPILAASSGIAWPRFLVLTSAGAALYVTALVLAGYFLGQQFPQLGQYVQYIFLGVIVLVLGTLLWQRLKPEKP